MNILHRSSASVLAQIKDRITLPEVVRRYSGIALQPRGNRSVCCCPFHQEKTPSFTVFEDGKWHCFGCGKNGDVIDFTQEALGLSLPDTLKKLTADFGIGGDEQAPAPFKPRRSIRQIVHAQYFGLIDVLLLDRRILQMKLKEYSDPDQLSAGMVHELGMVEGLLDDLLTGWPEDKAAAVDRGRRFYRGGHRTTVA